MNANLTRNDYIALRRTYRLLRRQDAQWRPDEYAARNVLQAPPDRAVQFFSLLEPRLAATLLRRLGDENRDPFRLARGPRARSLIAAPVSGPYAGLDLPKRVGLRRGLRQMRQLERAA